MIQRISEPNVDRTVDQLIDLQIRLTESLALADLLEMNLVAIKVCEALDLIKESGIFLSEPAIG